VTFKAHILYGFTGFDVTSKMAMKTAAISAAKIDFQLASAFYQFTVQHVY